MQKQHQFENKHRSASSKTENKKYLFTACPKFWTILTGSLYLSTTRHIFIFNFSFSNVYGRIKFTVLFSSVLDTLVIIW